MGVAELLGTVEYLVDPSGKRKAVVVDYAVWEQVLTLLEDLEDAKEIRRLRQAGEKAIPWEEAKAQLRAEGVHVERSHPLRSLK